MRGLGNERPEDDVEEEIRFHLEGRVAELMAQGMDRKTAERTVRQRFGDESRVAAECVELDDQRLRAARRRSRFDALRLDLLLAWRGIFRDRGVALAVVLTLGITIGAITSLFSVTDSLLLRPLPYPDDGALSYVWQNDRVTGTTREGAGTADFFDFRERATSFDAMSMFARSSGTLATDGTTRFVSIAQVHHDLGTVLGIEPVLGRGIRPEETRPGGPNVALLTERIWRDAFDSDPGVLGRTVSVGEVPFEVIGVLPDGASTIIGPVDVWTPLQVDRATATRNPHFVTVVARMAGDATLEGSRAEMTAIAAELEAQVPENVDRGAFVEPVADYLRGDLRETLWVLLAATFVLLLIGTANVGSLLSARATHRDRATAVHTALGASPGRTLMRGFVESGILLAAAAGIGVVLAIFGVDALVRVAPPEFFQVGAVEVDLRVLTFTLLISALLALAFGSIPARHARRQDLQRSLGHGGAGRTGRSAGMSLLVAGQSALATVLLVGSLLLGATVRNLTQTDLGFSTESLVRASLVLPDARYPRDFANFPNWNEVLDVQARLLGALDATPGVESHALMVNHPLDPGFTNSISIEDGSVPEGVGELTTRMVSGGYFETASVELLEGRVFTPGVSPADPGEVVLNRTAARLLFPEGGALGRRIGFWGQGFREIVGVVENERVAGHRAEAPPAFYTNLQQTPAASGPILVLARASGDPAALGPALQQAILSVEPAAAVYDVSTMAETLGDALVRERLAGGLLTAFSAIALFLAAIGVHGVLAFSVARRRREIGVRLALGEGRTGVRSRILRRAAVLVGTGVFFGLAISWFGARFLDSLLYGVSSTDLRIHLGAGTLLLLVGLIGAMAPALRASSVEPASSLRSE